MARISYSAVVLDDKSRKELLSGTTELLLRGIYVIENLTNNKKYVGSTMKSFFVRFKAHIKSLKNNRHENKILQSSWNIHKIESFRFTIIKSFDYIEVNELLKLETFYINYYNSDNRTVGYNICGVGGSNIGTKWTDESKEKRCGVGNPMFGKGDSRKGALNPMFGKTLTDLHKSRMSLSLTGIKKPTIGIKLSKPVLQLDDNQRIINEYSSYLSATKTTKILHISEVCNGQRKKAGGYYWKWKTIKIIKNE